MDYKKFSEGNMKKKTVFIAFYLVMACLALEFGFAVPMPPNGTNDSEKLRNEAEQTLSNLKDKINEAKNINLSDNSIVKEAEKKLDSWLKNFDDYKRKNSAKDYKSINAEGNNLINQIGDLLKRAVDPNEDSLNEKLKEKITKLETKLGLLENELKKVKKGGDNSGTNPQDITQEKLDLLEKNILNMQIFLLISVVVLIMFSMFAGWYFGKQSVLRYLEKAGLW